MVHWGGCFNTKNTPTNYSLNNNNNNNNDDDDDDDDNDGNTTIIHKAP